jgi:hypothetical protein
MGTGIVEYAVTEFPGSHFNGAIAPALKDLVDRNLIKIIDMTFVHKNADGAVEALEYGALPEDEAALFADLDGEINGLLSEADIESLAAGLAPNSSSAILVWENVWSAALIEAVRGSKGRVTAHGTVRAERLAEAMAALDAE